MCSHQTGSGSGGGPRGGPGDDCGVKHVGVVARGDDGGDGGVRGGQHSHVAENVVHIGALEGRKGGKMGSRPGLRFDFWYFFTSLCHAFKLAVVDRALWNRILCVCLFPVNIQHCLLVLYTHMALRPQ